MKKLDVTKLSTIGSRWQKYGADRFYFDLKSANEMYRNLETAEHGRLTLNRRERTNGKVWIDLNTKEFGTKGIDNPYEAISQISELIKVLCPEETEATAEEIQGDSEIEIAIKYTDNIGNAHMNTVYIPEELAHIASVNEQYAAVFEYVTENYIIDISELIDIEIV